MNVAKVLCQPHKIPEKIARHIRNRKRISKLTRSLATQSEPARSPLLEEGQESKHIVLAETERHGLPLRTVLCSETGMIFFDPMPNGAFLTQFYATAYQSIQRSASPDETIRKLEKQRTEKLVNFLEGLLLPNPCKVLDVGCSAGHILDELAKARPDIKFVLHGIEPDANYISYINEKLPHIYTHCMMIEDYETDQNFDLILMMHGLEHIRDMPGVLHKVSDLLAEDGVLYLETPNIFKVPKCVPLHKFFLISKLWCFSPETLKVFMAYNGFKCVKFDTKSDKHILAAFNKKQGASSIRSGDLKLVAQDIKEYLYGARNGQVNND